MARIPAGCFRMGSERHYPEERPARDVEVGAFKIDVHPVTNRQFAGFVAATGYVSVAERPLDPARYPGIEPRALKPGALAFMRPAARVELGDWAQWWVYVRGAHWRRPEGRSSVFPQRLDHPVVDVAYEDALAYAHWVGKDLPTEAEWEYAARGGLDGAKFVWGDELTPGGLHMANTWQGEFPYDDRGEDGFRGTSPVGAFPANGYGLLDMAGNVWEWTKDWFLVGEAAAADQPCCGPVPSGKPPAASYDPAFPQIRIPRKVVKGGSFLCAPNYCARYRPAARQPQMIDTAAAHIGFRCVIRGADA